MVGRKDIGLALLHIFVPVDNLDRDKEYPAGEAAPEDGRYVVTVLYFDVASEKTDEDCCSASQQNSCPPGKEYLIQYIEGV